LGFQGVGFLGLGFRVRVSLGFLGLGFRIGFGDGIEKYLRLGFLVSRGLFVGTCWARRKGKEN